MVQWARGADRGRRRRRKPFQGRPWEAWRLQQDPITANSPRCGDSVTRQTALLPDDANLIPAGSGGYTDLRVAVIRIAPAAAFEEAVRSGDPPERDATRQIASRINDAAPTLAYVQSFSARMLACRRTMPGPDAAHAH